MKDRFVRVMLVLITILLALNCATDPRRPVVDAQAQGKTQYKAVPHPLNDASAVQRSLDQMSAQGWEYVGSASMVLIFKK